MLIYCDSCILIYYYDHAGSINLRATNRLADLHAAGDQIAVSDLVRLECRVRPIKIHDHAKLAAFDSFFARADVQVLPISKAVFDRATLIRAMHNFKLGNSLHLAAAIEFGCARFLTNDTRLSATNVIPIEVLP
jgi:predicted nucleic acid-binding protein